MNKGKVVTGWILLVLPLLAGLGLLFARHGDGVASLLEKIAKSCSAGFQKLTHGEIG